jgi:hypothetical protein
MARGARRVIVTVERVVGAGEIRASAQDTVLYGFEVDAVVEVAKGAWPTAFPPDYSVDEKELAELSQ